MKKTWMVLLAIIIMLPLAACGGGGDSDDPNLGLYTCIEAEYMGMTISVEDLAADGDITIELKSGGKGELNQGSDSYNITWKLDGEDFEFKDSSVTVLGTLADGVMVVEFEEDMFLTFLQEGVELPE